MRPAAAGDVSVALATSMELVYVSLRGSAAPVSRASQTSILTTERERPLPEARPRALARSGIAQMSVVALYAIEEQSASSDLPDPTDLSGAGTASSMAAFALSDWKIASRAVSGDQTRESSRSNGSVCGVDDEGRVGGSLEQVEKQKAAPIETVIRS